MKLGARDNRRIPLVVGIAAIAGISAAAAPGCGGSNFGGGPDTSGVDGAAIEDDGGTLPADGGSESRATDAKAPNPPPIPPPAGCDPEADPKDSTDCVVDAYGIFVNAAAGSDINAGTKASPMKTLAAAIGKAAGNALPRVYVCEGTYPESLTFDLSRDGISVFGGFSCADWTYTATRAQVKPAAQGPVMTFTKTMRAVSIVDLEILAADATPAATSSVAVLASASLGVTFRRSRIKAGAAAAGTAGAPGASPSSVQMGIGYSCMGSTEITAGGTGAPIGPAPLFECTDNGGDGLPLPPLGGSGGMAGINPCQPGSPGNDGTPGGAGGGATRVGDLSAMGFAPASGTAGTFGTVGGGGGGGGCGGGGQKGGNGGIGGCGSGGGGPGTGAGASLAVVSLDTAMTFTECELITASGAKGGAGGSAPSGETGKNGLGAVCTGGKGGNGGTGGAGGGGAGGLSVGVLYTSVTPTLDALTQSKAQIGQAGPGGAPGNGGPPTANGIAGISATTHQAK